MLQTPLLKGQHVYFWLSVLKAFLHCWQHTYNLWLQHRLRLIFRLSLTVIILKNFIFTLEYINQCLGVVGSYVESNCFAFTSCNLMTQFSRTGVCQFHSKRVPNNFSLSLMLFLCVGPLCVWWWPCGAVEFLQLPKDRASHCPVLLFLSHCLPKHLSILSSPFYHQESPRRKVQ